MKPDALLRRCAQGKVANVRFSDVVSLVVSLGFVPLRVSGSHHIFVHPDVPEFVNIQDVGGQAKPYQVRQVVRLAERYDLQVEKER